MCCLTWMEIMTEKQIKKQQFINVKLKKGEGGGCWRGGGWGAAGRYFFLPDEPSAAAAAAAAASAFNFSSLCSRKTLYSSADRLRKRGINIGLLRCFVSQVWTSALSRGTNQKPGEKSTVKHTHNSSSQNTSTSQGCAAAAAACLHLKGGKILGKSRSSLIEELVKFEYEIMKRKPITGSEEHRSGSKKQKSPDGCRCYCVQYKQI